jgi:hypothetical protein
MDPQRIPTWTSEISERKITTVHPPAAVVTQEFRAYFVQT